MGVVRGCLSRGFGRSGTPAIGVLTLATAYVYELDKVGFAYKGEISALEDVSLRIEAGECWAILGANGSGKSTLLKLLDGLYFPTHGTIRAFDEELSERHFRDEAFNSVFRSRVGFVFQDPDIQLFSASVLDEVAFAPLQLGLPMAEVEARVDGAFKALQIEKLRDRPPHHLSGGEKKRVALASVLSLGPQVWLLDEPTAGLDPRSQDWLIEFTMEQHQAGKTIVIATHDLAIIQKLATHVLVFDESHHIAAIGNPGDILRDHTLLHACNLVHEHWSSSNSLS
jgi:cobalt/nickel transport system ATP-binding protein